MGKNAAAVKRLKTSENMRINACVNIKALLECFAAQCKEESNY